MHGRLNQSEPGCGVEPNRITQALIQPILGGRGAGASLARPDSLRSAANRGPLSARPGIFVERARSRGMNVIANCVVLPHGQDDRIPVPVAFFEQQL